MQDKDLGKVLAALNHAWDTSERGNKLINALNHAWDTSERGKQMISILSRQHSLQREEDEAHAHNTHARTQVRC